MVEIVEKVLAGIKQPASAVDIRQPSAIDISVDGITSSVLLSQITSPHTAEMDWYHALCIIIVLIIISYRIALVEERACEVTPPF